MRYGKIEPLIEKWGNGMAKCPNCKTENQKPNKTWKCARTVMKALRKMIEQQLMLTSEKGFLTDKEVLEAFLKSS